MKKQFLISILTGTLLVTGAAQAASWQESLSSAASELTKESGTSRGGLSASSLTGLLSNSSQSLSAGTMNNAAGILEYCAKQKLASVTDTENIKNRVLGKLGLDTRGAESGHQLYGRYSGPAERAKWPAAEPQHPWKFISGETGENESLRSGAETRR